MEKYKLTVTVFLKNRWASLADFEREIEYFNRSNEEAIEIGIDEVQLS